MKQMEKLSGLVEYLVLLGLVLAPIVIWGLSPIIPHYASWLTLWGVVVILATLFAPWQPFIWARNSGEWIFLLLWPVGVCALFLIIRQ